ncbi:MAG: cyclic nucleotide-binding domain-containing protein [Methylobacter sp.]|nr:cyclic nucleotide-binding domain-containing protein [Methylobacter sp.]
MFIEETQEDSDDWMSALLRSPIFQRLPPTNLQKIIMSLEAVHFNKGDVIIEQGSQGDYYYLIKNGHCELTRKPTPNAKEIKLARLASGDTFGEDALLSDAPRNVTITALTSISLLRLNKPQFISLIKEPSLTFVNQAEMQKAVQQGATLLDVRTPDDYNIHHLEGSINEPFFSLRMQLKTLNREKPIIVICGDGKTSEAAVFLLLRNKINAMLLKGGLASLNPEPEQGISSANATDDNVVVDVETLKTIPQKHEIEQPVDNAASVSSSAQDDHIKALLSEIETLKSTNQQLTNKCMELEFNKQHAEKKIRLYHKQLEKLTLELDQLKKA